MPVLILSQGTSKQLASSVVIGDDTSKLVLQAGRQKMWLLILCVDGSMTELDQKLTKSTSRKRSLWSV